MNTPKILLVVAAVALAGWAAWYFFIREKTLEEKLDGAARQVERSVNDAVRQITR